MRGMHERNDDESTISPLFWIVPLVFFCGMVVGAILCDAGIINIR